MKRSFSMVVSCVFVMLTLLGVLVVTQHAAVVAAPLDLTPIGTARQNGDGWTGGVQGNVTVVPGIIRTDTFAIQDATGGIYVFVASSTGVSIPPMALGDVVQVSGTLKLYNGLLEFDPVSAIVNIGPGAVPAPTVVSTSVTSVDPTQGLLIQVSGTASWATTPPAPGASDWSFTIDDGSGSVTVFVDKDTHIDMRSYTSPTPMTLIGFSGTYKAPQIMPRNQTDVI